jgi:hypothetical protein
VHRLQCERDSERCLPNTGRPDEQHVGFLGDEARRGELFDQPPVKRRLGVEVEFLKRLMRRQPGEPQTAC